MQNRDLRSLHIRHNDGVVGRAEEVVRSAEFKPRRLELQDVAGLNFGERDLSPEVEVVRPARTRLPQRLGGERPAFAVADFATHLRERILQHATVEQRNAR